MNLARPMTTYRYLWVLPVVVFMWIASYHIDLPGLYMDAVNPDFIVAQKLHPHLHNPTATLPSKIFPILGNLYHGVQNAYVDLPALALFGFSVTVVRVAQALFGAALIAAFFVTAKRLSKSTALAMAASLGLATEIAFSASFRTQFYIVMGGATWLFFSLMVATPSESDRDLSGRRLFWSGVFSGLACYGYFVLMFFIPGTFAMVALRPRSNLRDTVRWIFGLAVGFSPFALGYLSLMLKLHGVGPAVALIKGLLNVLHPFESGGAQDSNLLYVWRMAQLAITNSGNDTMIFGHALPSWWGLAKFWLLVIVTLICAIWSLRCLALRKDIPQWSLLGWLPISYLLVASLFGHRLWAHHFCVLVPFVYLLPLPLFANMFAAAKLGNSARTAVIGLGCFGCVAGNLAQQYQFHQALSLSGGEGMSTQALTQLAVEARQATADTAYVFPEWGFFTSFCLLTENKVRYVDDATPETLANLRNTGYNDLRLAYWRPSEREHYTQVLQQAGLQTITLQTFKTRDGREVFYLLDGRNPSH